MLVLFIALLGGEAQDDLEARVAKLEEETRKLEELVKMGTLRSCAEYSQFGIKADGYYQVDPDGPLLGHPPFQVFCNFTSGAASNIQPLFQTDYIKSN